MESALSFVIPTYRSANYISSLVQQIISSDSWSSTSEIILVDDASDDETWPTIRDLAYSISTVRSLRLSRNSGQHAALLAGVRSAKNPLIVTLDDDLQNPPSEIAKLVLALTDTFDVVYGVPSRTSHSIWRRASSRISKRFMHAVLAADNSIEASPFRVFRTQLRDGFASELGPGVSLDALLNWSTSRFTSVEVEHHERINGKSNYSFWKLLRFMIDTATGYSTLPLRLATGLGLATIALSIGVLFYVLGRPLVTGESVPGFPFLAATIAIFSGTQLVVLGILGQYIGRMHFRVMNKPTYTVAERTGP